MDALERIANQLDGINNDDLSRAEKNIVKILVSEGLVELEPDEDGHSIVRCVKNEHEQTSLHEEYEADAVEVVQGLLHKAIKQRSLPPRFVRLPHGNKVTFTDTITGKSLTTGICNCLGVEQAINTFIGSA
jgi:hypothetical protein